MSSIKGPLIGLLLTVLGGSWGLSKWMNNGVNWGYCMVYRGFNLLTPSP